jgi:hypothetical protein
MSSHRSSWTRVGEDVLSNCAPEEASDVQRALMAAVDPLTPRTSVDNWMQAAEAAMTDSAPFEAPTRREMLLRQAAEPEPSVDEEVDSLHRTATAASPLQLIAVAAAVLLCVLSALACHFKAFSASDGPMAQPTACSFGNTAPSPAVIAAAPQALGAGCAPGAACLTFTAALRDEEGTLNSSTLAVAVSSLAKLAEGLSVAPPQLLAFYWGSTAETPGAATPPNLPLVLVQATMLFGGIALLLARKRPAARRLSRERTPAAVPRSPGATHVHTATQTPPPKRCSWLALLPVEGGSYYMGMRRRSVRLLLATEAQEAL